MVATNVSSTTAYADLTARVPGDLEDAWTAAVSENAAVSSGRSG